MRHIAILSLLLSTTTTSPAAEMAAWVVFPNETVLSGRAACESDQRCQVKITDWGYIFAYSLNGTFDYIETSPDGVRGGRQLKYDPAKTYNKIPLFFYRESMGGREKYYLGTLYVQIRQ